MHSLVMIFFTQSMHKKNQNIGLLQENHQFMLSEIVKLGKNSDPIDP
jgi:hypothetical protein